MRAESPLRAVQRAFSLSATQEFSIVHYSLQTNHLHLIVEAQDSQALSRGMHASTIRSARALNRLWSRMGAVFEDHYHSRALRTPREVRNALVYVLANARKHGCPYGAVDPFSSGPWLDGWRGIAALGPRGPFPAVNPRTWLLRKGWQIHGLIDPRESPRGASRPRRASP